MAADPRERARVQALCWLLDELLDAEDDLLALVARPGALAGWRRERLGPSVWSGGVGSVAFVARQPVLQVVGPGEIEQIHRQLLEARQGKGGDAFACGWPQLLEAAVELTDGQSGGFLLPTCFPALLPAPLPAEL
jgi:hypothetical protein